MTIKTSGPITIQDIVDEFGGGTPHKLGEYYRGGTKVPNNSYNQNVPTAGAISIGDFYGARASIELSVTLWGGGGGGGNGFADGSGSGAAGRGNPTAIFDQALYDYFIANGRNMQTMMINSLSTFKSSEGDRMWIGGGPGGSIASNNGGVTGTAGGSSSFGSGGAGGAVNAAGGDPSWGSWATGGGGGGGDNGSGSYLGYNNDSPGEAGTGGSAGQIASFSNALFDTEVYYYVVVGGGGANGTGGNYLGGDGNPGVFAFNISNPTVPQFAGGKLIADGVLTPPNSDPGGQSAHTSNSIWRIKMTNAGVVESTRII
jgi:hypothetical protein|tara:strand:+ start:31231 stop:32175 length:945 start_codon:yes stop_codon:yes gene_type:complete